MLRIGSMNMMLHGLTSPRFHYADTLSKAFTEERLYDIVLANPPFKGAIDASDVNPTLPTRSRRRRSFSFTCFCVSWRTAAERPLSSLTASFLARQGRMWRSGGN